MRIQRFMVGTTVAVVVGLATAGCGGGGEGASVTRAEFGEEELDWPFSLEEGTLHCDDEGAVYFRALTGEEYALNDVAEESRAYAAPDPVWLDQVETDGGDEGEGDVTVSPKVPLDDLIERGEQECDA